MLFAQLNYNSAISDAKRNAGTDIEITTIMDKYGFHNDAFEPITMGDKVKAIFQ